MRKSEYCAGCEAWCARWRNSMAFPRLQTAGPIPRPGAAGGRGAREQGCAVGGASPARIHLAHEARDAGNLKPPLHPAGLWPGLFTYQGHSPCCLFLGDSGVNFHRLWGAGSSVCPGVPTPCSRGNSHSDAQAVELGFVELLVQPVGRLPALLLSGWDLPHGTCSSV